MSKNPIGLFDSGIGGTSIFREIHALMPYENTLYLADSANAPYGDKSQSEIVRLSIKNTEYLIEQGCKLVVVACNTATTNAIKVLRAQFDIPIVGIEPAIKPAALQTQTKAIGVLATRGTLSSELFHATTIIYNKDIKVIEQVGEGIVKLIEHGEIDSVAMDELLQQYTAPMIAANIDYLVLGCTHYPYLLPKLLKLLPKQVKIIDSGRAIARQTKSILEQRHLLNPSTEPSHHQFYSNSANISILKHILDNAFDVNYLDF